MTAPRPGGADGQVRVRRGRRGTFGLRPFHAVGMWLVESIHADVPHVVVKVPAVGDYAGPPDAVLGRFIAALPHKPAQAQKPARAAPPTVERSVIELLRPEDAFARLNISRSHGYQMLKRGELPSVLIGSSRRIPLAALERWIEEQVAVQS